MKKTRQAFEAMDAITDGIAVLNENRNAEHHEPYIWLSVKKVWDGIDFDHYGQVKVNVNDQNPDEVIQMFEILMQTDPFIKKCIRKAMMKNLSKEATEAVNNAGLAFKKLSDALPFMLNESIANKFPSGGFITGNAHHPEPYRIKKDWFEKRFIDREPMGDWQKPSAEMEAGNKMEAIVRAMHSCPTTELEPKLTEKSNDYSIQLAIQDAVKSPESYIVTNLKGDENYSKCENGVTDYFNDLHVFFFYSCQDRTRIVLINDFKTLQEAVASGWDIYKFNF